MPRGFVKGFGWAFRPLRLPCEVALHPAIASDREEHEVMSVALNTFDSTEYRAARPVLAFGQAQELATEFGTPLLVFSRSVLVDSYRTLCRSLPNLEFFYAAKANPHNRILQTVREIGCSIDVCSPGEMKEAMKAGFCADEMIHTHPSALSGNNLISAGQSDQV